MYLLVELYESVINAFIRFWENRFRQSDEISFLRLELAKLHNERVKLLNYILELNKSLNEDESGPIDTVKLPLPNKYVPWSAKKHQLEKDAQERADKLSEVKLNTSFLDKEDAIKK